MAAKYKCAPRGRTLAEKLKFFSRPDPSGCIIWIATRLRQGYGHVWWNGKLILAHRAAWMAYEGPIPEGMQALHTCDNPSCINHKHLFLGTNADNVADKVRKGRARLGAWGAPKGERHGHAKLTVAEVKAIRKFRGTEAEGGQAFGVSDALIGLIRRRKIWTHI